MPYQLSKSMHVFLIVLFFAQVSRTYASKDRVFWPVRLTCICNSGDTLIVIPRAADRFDFDCTIFDKRIPIAESRFDFNSGETLFQKYTASKISSIALVDGDKNVYVPDTIISRIDSLALNRPTILRNTGSKVGIDATDDFVLQFNIGAALIYGQVPHINFEFSRGGFVKATIWQKTSDKVERRIRL